jgi:hypothetical protein
VDRDSIIRVTDISNSIGCRPGKAWIVREA